MSIIKCKNIIKEGWLGRDAFILLVNRLHFPVVDHPPEVKPSEGLYCVCVHTCVQCVNLTLNIRLLTRNILIVYDGCLLNQIT